ncbi:hypothetical protein I551_5201 [Mycobacterium ulcerans str. Harvey]|uniref:DUF1990 domain-containing protein n=1 Tax=Mycobacterium ulcerans str. Harvey TaxID=1299332 RepID=A0ABN0QUF9_MYCUL|nr:hypothetical protein I551_5201 [Mycobacterium ulcerans str. Harvey]
MQRGAGLAVWATSDTVAVSTVAVIQMMGVSRAPCRVVYVIDEPDIRGFAYGTLPGTRNAARNGLPFATTRTLPGFLRRCRRSPGRRPGGARPVARLWH